MKCSVCGKSHEDVTLQRLTTPDGFTGDYFCAEHARNLLADGLVGDTLEFRNGNMLGQTRLMEGYLGKTHISWV